MTRDQKRLLTETWQQVVPFADKAATLFYDRLFEIDPSVRKLFHATDMARQREKLIAVLGGAVDGLDDLEALLPLVEELGRRHACYGVTDGHYDSVGAALLWTLEQGLGESWTPDVANAWTDVYALLSGAMRRGAPSRSTAAA
jgi:hemoglobin-like flavoprotein